MVGSALTLEQALELCQLYHSKSGHQNKKILLGLLETITDPTMRPSPEHVKRFKCGACEMAKSKKPPQRATHPSTKTECGYAPGESFFVDGSGAYKFATISKATQHFIIIDESSRAKFAVPTTNKKVATLIVCLEKIQAQWHVPIKKIRTDQEYSRTKELQDWTRKHGIALEASPPYIHQPNGIAERGHGLIQDLARTQLLEAGASNYLWDYSV